MTTTSDATHQFVRVKNATPAPLKISYYSPGGQKWQDLAPEAATDADVKKGPSGNFLVQVVPDGQANLSNTQSATPPTNPAHQIVLVKNATGAKITVSFYSPSGQKWEALDPNAEKNVDIAKGPAGYLLLQIVPNNN
jgi:hypothetical protein